MEPNQVLLSTAEEIANLAKILKSHSIIAFDTEFIRESTFFPIIEIIQIATETQSWIVDARLFKRGYPHDVFGSYDQAFNPLLEILEDSSILKVVHAAQGDQECLYTSFGRLAHPILDTAIAASLCGYGDAIGLGKLLKSVLSVTIKKGHARTNWSVRPLPQQLSEYAHSDVISLVTLAQKLMERLDELGRKDWALELSSKLADKSLYDPPIDVMARKLAQGSKLDPQSKAVLFELVRWREKRVRQINLPRRWVADDAVLLDLARVQPKDLEHLSAFRGLNKGQLKANGDMILSVIQAGIAASLTENNSFESEREKGPTTEEALLIDLLKCYLGILANKHRIAAKHLISTFQLLMVIRGNFQTLEDLVSADLLSPVAAKLMGDELLALLQGKRALAVKGGKVSLLSIT